MTHDCFQRSLTGSANPTTLAALRDALLPELISGVLRIREAARTFMQAT